VFYLDTSVVVAALTEETASRRVDGWLGRLAPHDAAISEWVIAEFSAALSIKVRNRQISVAHHDQALDAFRRMIAETFRLLSVQGHHFRTAARFADDYKAGLRAGDALHLAIAGDEGATLVSLDQRQSQAGRALGVSARLL
jgi:predicted nucleic acid-binding protein